MQYTHVFGNPIRVMSLIGMMWMFTHSASAGVLLNEPILGGQLLVAQDGYVTARFLGSDAGYFNTLYLFDADGADIELFDKRTPLGSEVSLGEFTAGTELIFRLAVRNTGESFFSGAAARNADGIAHASATTVIGDGGVLFTSVGFEDIYGGGDLDFNDFMFSLSNVVDPLAVPAPSALALIGLGLLGLGFRQHHRGPGRSG